MPPLRVDVAILVLLLAAAAVVMISLQALRRRRRPPRGIHVDLVGTPRHRDEPPSA